MRRILLTLLTVWSFAPCLWADGGFHCLDLSQVANRGVTESFDESTQKVQDLQEKIGFKNIPVGVQNFRGIPFQIIDPLQNKGLSFVVLKGHHQSEFPEAVSIPADHLKTAELFFLHTCRWGGTAPDIKIAEYDVVYDDGKVVVVPLHVGLEINNFWYADDTTVSFVGWWNKYKNAEMGLSIYPWKNPRPTVGIQTILFKSLGKMPIPILFAITAADQETAVASVSPKPEQTTQTDTSHWLPFNATTASAQGTVLDMSSFVEVPAGKHGALKVDYEKLLFADNTPARFWGTVLGDNWSGWSSDQMTQVAARLASSGCNLVVVDIANGTDVPSSLVALVDALKAKGVYTCLLNASKLVLPDTLTKDPALIPVGLLTFNQAVWNKPVATDAMPPYLFKDDPMVLHPDQSLPALLSYARPLGSPYGALWQDARPNEYVAEAPILMATYGLYENWDAVLGMKTLGFDWGGELEMGEGLFNKPSIWLQWPLASLAYLRGDLKPGRLFILKSKDPADLKPVDRLKALAHRSGFNTSAIHLKTDPTGELGLQVTPAEQSFTSDSKQIAWRGNTGQVRVQSPRFEAAIGFLGNRKVNTDEWMVETPNLFASIAAISLNEAPLSVSKHILISGVTRFENTGMLYNQAKTKLMDKGKAPALVEPLVAKITLKRLHKDPKLKVRGLDANGQVVAEKIPAKWSNNHFVLTWIPSVFYLEIYH